MNNLKTDYNRIFEETVKDFKNKKRLLLHSCCAPCSSAVLERVTPFFDVTVFFFNPNIDTENEYLKRAQELNKLANRFSLNEIIVPKFEPLVYLNEIAGQENSVEGGERCGNCFALRLKESAKMCKKINADYFSTTLTVSPHKNASVINAVGGMFSNSESVYLPSDFKKKEGYKRSIAISNELGIYRQAYCGCSFSKV